MREAMVVVIFLGPLVVASICFAFALFYAARMFGHIREDRKLLAYITGPRAFLSPAFYAPAGQPHFGLFQKWFQRFATALLIWGFFALSAALITKLV